MRTSQTQKLKSEKSSLNNQVTFSGVNKFTKVFATFCVAFLLSFAVSIMANPVSNSSAIECANGTTAGSGEGASSGDICGTDTADVNVSVEGGWAISVSSAGTLGIDVSPTNSGVLSTAVDNVNVYTNIPTGYQLYLNSTFGSTDIYNNNLLDENGNLSANLPSGVNTNHFTATTGTKDNPIALSNNTWGYSLDNSPTTFAKVALTNEDPDSNIYSNPTKTSSSGDDIPITYGFRADTSLSPGTYSTSVTYTAIADVPTYTITSVSPNELRINDQTDKTITIMTSTPTSELAFGNISAKIGTVDLINCTEITSDGYRGAECAYNGDLVVGMYNVELSSSWHNATYTLTDGFTIYKTAHDIATMQEMTADICDRLPESTSTIDNRVTLKDGRDQKQYKISKLADGNCWMVQNLALDGGRTLYPSDSNVTKNRILPSNIINGTTSVNDKIQIYSGSTGSTIDNSFATDTTTTAEAASNEYVVANGAVYGNLYNFLAATAGTGEPSIIGDIAESVCPSKWRLPSATGLYSITYLASKYGLPVTNVNKNTDSKVWQYMMTIQRAPFYMSLAGRYTNGAIRAVDDGFIYTTRSVSNTQATSYHINVDQAYGNYFPLWESGSLKSYGCSVRCVFGE